jgi:hypothetical protein
MLSITGEASGVAQEKSKEILSLLCGLTIDEAQDAIRSAQIKVDVFLRQQREKIIFNFTDQGTLV